jgi:hypothetical protein
MPGGFLLRRSVQSQPPVNEPLFLHEALRRARITFSSREIHSSSREIHSELSINRRSIIFTDSAMMLICPKRKWGV